MTKKIVSVVGARPQFIKATPVSRALREAGHHELLLHTGQHYDYGMSQVFFDELSIPEPNVNLGIGSGSHGHQTGRMLMAIEDVLLTEKPDWVVVYGDTNSTLAGALAAVKLHTPVAHVEAGLRSFNREMPEEHNRVLTDHCADLLFCPTQTAVDNLAREGLVQQAHWVGDTMYDAVLLFIEIARQHSEVLKRLELTSKCYLLATLHRPYNTDIPDNLHSILDAFLEVGEPIVFPVHPRTRSRLDEFDRRFLSSLKKSKVKLIAPVGYLDMLVLEQNARLVLTDSGGMQKEAFFLGVPCITLRPETEWIETVQSGWNILVGADRQQIITTVQEHEWPDDNPPAMFGNGQASEHVVGILSSVRI
jgi:UDP-GlcNAc3NAcA epimerase